MRILAFETSAKAASVAIMENGKLLGDLDISAEDLAAIIKLVDDGEINRVSGRKILAAVIEEGVNPIAYCKDNKLDEKVDTTVIEEIMDKVLIENAQALEDYRNGKVKAKQALFGACMRALKNTADTDIIKELLERKIDN